jgi:deferrochelatase/peroxidase EfeB
LDLEALPPYGYAKEHFGCRDRLSVPTIEGLDIEPTPGSPPPGKPGEFILGYPDEEGSDTSLPQPQILSRNGSFLAYRRLQQHVGAFGPPLPEGASEDGVERGIAAFIGGASLARQFEFAQNVWANDKDFHGLANERDPIIGTHDGTLENKVPKRPIRKRIVGLPAFTIVRGGAYFFLPGIQALRFLAGQENERTLQ